MSKNIKNIFHIPFDRAQKIFWNEKTNSSYLESELTRRAKLSCSTPEKFEGLIGNINKDSITIFLMTHLTKTDNTRVYTLQICLTDDEEKDDIAYATLLKVYNETMEWCPKKQSIV